MPELSPAADLTQSKCRIAGVVLVENQDRSQKFNYTMAESACQELGLQLASKAQVEKAKGYGYETCSYGWVSEQVGVIPRIQNNENCGRNKTGVLTWKVDLNKMFFSAYCFNESDIRINSCKPGLMVTQPPSSSAAVPTSGSTMVTQLTSSSAAVPTSESTMTSTSLKTETQTEPRATSPPPVWTTWKASTASLHTTLVTTVKPTRSTTTLQITPTTDTVSPTKQENQMAQKSERVVFGGLPTTLLVLALLFFIAAVVLAICYIKKYKTHLLFTKKKKEKESVEAMVFKDASGGENAKEQYTNRKETECLQHPTGNSVEAEV
ncbi:lymphatic vessel endothelial hyaluronic acid receptor 1 isoform X2 [Dendrobates tinctorius]|uniref:lymphatic vessel endothelial hyaluronic acid receptor 1 isoform X2 n=1 Tax=Dendrobates tinctorius TaxID=92724 RepID=UPI003CC9624A